MEGVGEWGWRDGQGRQVCWFYIWGCLMECYYYRPLVAAIKSDVIKFLGYRFITNRHSQMQGSSAHSRGKMGTPITDHGNLLLKFRYFQLLTL
jgi:hypothetical protein